MERMAIMKNVGYGCRDAGSPVLFFETYITESAVALQILSGKMADKFIKTYGVYDIKDLEGKVVWVIEENNVIKISRPFGGWKSGTK